MHRFFVSKEAIIENSIKITGEDVSHISRVLRLREKDTIIICDGERYEYICSISSIDKREVTCDIIETKAIESEPPLRVDIYQGIPKAVKMDLIVQKCTELGIYRIIPVETDRVVAKIGNDRDIGSKITRWKRIAQEAAKQSGRGRIPLIYDPIKFYESLKGLRDYDVAIMPYEKEHSTGLKAVLKGKNNIKSIAIFIGPEGGFDDEEVNEAQKNGVISVTLGPRILRTETAGFACLTSVMYELGDMGGKPWQV